MELAFLDSEPFVHLRKPVESPEGRGEGEMKMF